MKLLLVSAVCLGLGVALHRAQRPTAEELELQATLAWNENRYDDAERLARRALGRKPLSSRAREVLIQVSHAENRPEIPLALTLGDLQHTDASEGVYRELGQMAMARDLLRVADDFIAAGVRKFPRNRGFHHQYVALSGLRLDAEEMQQRLKNWASYEAPPTDMVLMMFGLWSMESRSAAPSESWLRAAVEADSTDEASRVGLARCLLAMGRYQECLELLEPYRNSPQSRLMLVIAAATLQPGSAAALLPPDEPETMRAEYWFAQGLIALGRDDLSTAEKALAKAVEFQPLNKSYRSRYCDVLRLHDPHGRREEQVRELEIVVRIVRRSMEPGIAKNAPAVQELARMCRSVEAIEAAELLQRSLES